MIQFDIVAISGIGIFLWISTDLPQYDTGDVHGDTEWRRALFYYASAPLGLFPAAGAVLLVLHNYLIAVLPIVLVAVLGLWWLDLVLITFVIQRSIRASVAFAILLPAFSLVIAIVSFFAAATVAAIFTALGTFH